MSDENQNEVLWVVWVLWLICSLDFFDILLISLALWWSFLSANCTEWRSKVYSGTGPRVAAVEGALAGNMCHHVSMSSIWHFKKIPKPATLFANSKPSQTPDHCGSLAKFGWCQWTALSGSEVKKGKRVRSLKTEAEQSISGSTFILLGCSLLYTLDVLATWQGWEGQEQTPQIHSVGLAKAFRFLATGCYRSSFATSNP